MAQRTVNVCDVHAKGGEVVPATMHTLLALDSDRQELDLCEAHAEQLRAAISGFLGARPRRGRPAKAAKAGRGRPAKTAAKAGRGRPAKKAGPRGRKVTAARKTAKAAPRKRAAAARGGAAFTENVRQWARAQGLDVKERGRLPRTVVEQYGAAHK